MMSQIILINGILNIFMCSLFFFHTNKYRYLMNKFKMIMFSMFSLYFLFIGFIRIKIALKMDNWSLHIQYNYENLFNIINIINNIIIIIFLYLSITYKPNLKNDSNS